MSEKDWFFRNSMIFIMCLIMVMASYMCMFELIEKGDLLILLMLFLGFIAIILHLDNE